jgi:hypothetical protein
MREVFITHNLFTPLKPHKKRWLMDIKADKNDIHQ